MTLQGYIKGDGGVPIRANVLLFDPASGSSQVIEILPGEQYTIEGDETAIGNMVVTFSATGYADLVTTVSELILQAGDVRLRRPSLLVPLIVTAGALVLMKKRKKVGGLIDANIPTPVLVGVGVIGFFVVKSALEKLGIWRSGDTRDLDSASSDPLRWWNPTFWRSKPTNISYTNPITESTARQMAKNIYDAFGWFNDNEEQAINVFKQLPSQAAGSFVSYAFQNEYNMDLLTFLRGGSWPQDRLSDNDVNTIDDFVNGLPKY